MAEDLPTQGQAGEQVNDISRFAATLDILEGAELHEASNQARQAILDIIDSAIAADAENDGTLPSEVAVQHHAPEGSHADRYPVREGITVSAEGGGLWKIDRGDKADRFGSDTVTIEYTPQASSDDIKRVFGASGDWSGDSATFTNHGVGYIARSEKRPDDEVPAEKRFIDLAAKVQSRVTELGIDPTPRTKAA